MHSFSDHADRSAVQLSSSAASASASLSEDVDHLLRWGRRVLEQQRAERRRQPRHNAGATPSSHQPDHPLLSEPSGTSPAPTHPSRETAAAAWPASQEEPLGLLLTPPPLYTREAVDTLQQRLAQLDAVEAENTRVFEQRWQRLLRARECLRRRSDPVAAAERARQVRRVVTTVQAVVEGEGVALRALRSVALRLRKRLHGQLHQSNSDNSSSGDALLQHRRDEEKNRSRGDMRGDATRVWEVEDMEDGEDLATHDLMRLVALVEAEVKNLVRVVKLRREAEANEEHRRAEESRRLHSELHALRHEVEHLSTAVKKKKAEVREAQAQQRVAEVAAAAARRHQAVRDALARVEEMQAEASALCTVARHDREASEARFLEAQSVHHVAARRHAAAEEALAAAKRRSSEVQRRLTSAVEAEAELLEALAEERQQCEEVAALRRMCEADMKALLDVAREQQRRRHRADQPESASAGSCIEERLAACQAEAGELRRELDAMTADNAALEKRRAALRARLQTAQAESAALRDRKRTLEAALTSESHADRAEGSSV